VDDWGLPLKNRAAGLEAAWQERLRFAPGWKYETAGDMVGVSRPSRTNRIKSPVMSTEERFCLEEDPE
jgi:hypothetical protein